MEPDSESKEAAGESTDVEGVHRWKGVEVSDGVNIRVERRREEEINDDEEGTVDEAPGSEVKGSGVADTVAGGRTTDANLVRWRNIVVVTGHIIVFFLNLCEISLIKQIKGF